jgi:hypothetical protein
VSIDAHLQHSEEPAPFGFVVRSWYVIEEVEVHRTHPIRPIDVPWRGNVKPEKGILAHDFFCFFLFCNFAKY